MIAPILHFVSAVEAYTSYVMAPHRESAIMLAFAFTWGATFCAPAFKKKSK